MYNSKGFYPNQFVKSNERDINSFPVMLEKNAQTCCWPVATIKVSIVQCWALSDILFLLLARSGRLKRFQEIMLIIQAHQSLFNCSSLGGKLPVCRKRTNKPLNKFCPWTEKLINAANASVIDRQHISRKYKGFHYTWITHRLPGCKRCLLISQFRVCQING